MPYFRTSRIQHSVYRNNVKEDFRGFGDRMVGAFDFIQISNVVVIRAFAPLVPKDL